MIFAEKQTSKILKMNTDEVNNLRDMCRVCMMTSDYLKQTISYELSPNIVNMLNNFANIEVPLNDRRLPAFICNTCYTSLRESCKFQNLCVETNNTLKTYVLKMQEQDTGKTENNTVKTVHNMIKTEHTSVKIETTPKRKKKTTLLNNNCFIYNEDENKFDDSKTLELNENYINTNVEIEIIDVPGIKLEGATTPTFDYNPEYTEPSPDYLNALGLVKIQRESESPKNIKKELKKEFKCKICSVVLYDYGSYRRHLASHGELPFPCKICDKRFKDARKLKHHVTNAHCGMRPYSCSQCEAKFRTLVELTAHLRRHSGTVDPHACLQCPRRFASAKLLKEHQSSHEIDRKAQDKLRKSSNGFGDHVCSLCDRRFRKRCDLERHERVHSGEKPYECLICGGRFQQAHNLTKHMVTHTGMRSYTCDICHKTFGRSDVLARHMHVHEVSKPHSCKICSRTFARHSQLVTHTDKRHATNTDT